jgi:alanine dehydrogenase
VVHYEPTRSWARKVHHTPGRDRNRYVGLVFLYSAETLELLAIMTDGHLQRMRVAAVTGIGISYLARKDARTAALLGTGWQAETAAWAMVCTRPVSRIKVYSPNPEHRRRFAEKAAGELGREVVAVESAREAVEGADIVACATNAAEPVVSGEWVGAGTHLTCIRAHEFDEEAWARSDVIVFSGSPASSGYFTYGTKDV